MTNKKSILGMSAIALILGLAFAGCPIPFDNGSPATTTYTVNFNPAGGAPEPEKLQVEQGAKIDRPAVTRDGYLLDGWYKNAEKDSPWNFDTETVDADTTLYAQWLLLPPESFAVSFQANGGKPEPPPQVVKKDDQASPPDAPVKDGYNFDGWYVESDFSGPQWDFATTPVIRSVILHAKWTSNSGNIPTGPFTVVFLPNGGTSAIPDQTVSYGGLVERPTPDPIDHTRTRDFQGWYASSDFSGPEWNFAKPVTEPGLTLYGKWSTPALGGSVAINGTLQVGEILSAAIENLQGFFGRPYYLWKAGDRKVGEDATYIPTWGDMGKNITVTVSFSGSAGEKTCVSSETVELPSSIDEQYIEGYFDWKLNNASETPLNVSLDSSVVIRDIFSEDCVWKIILDKIQSFGKNVILDLSACTVTEPQIANAGTGDNQYIKGIILPSGVTDISPHAFYSWRGLTSITIPDSVAAIGATAFYSCTELTEVTFDNCSDISENDFSDSAFPDDLKSVYVTSSPSSGTYIREVNSWTKQP